MRWQRCTVELVQLESVPFNWVLVYVPENVKLGIIVIFYEVGDGGAGILYLLVAVAEWRHDDGAVGGENVCAVRPVHDACDAGRYGTC